MARVERVAVVGAGAAGLVALRQARRTRREQRIASAEPHLHDLHAEQVWLQSSAGTRLHAWWAPASASPAPAVLVAHGYASHAGDLLPMARPLQQAGFHVLLVDVRGHGRSEPWDGRPSPPVFAEDIGSGVDWLGARDEVTTIGLLGHSMGGSAAIVAASDRAEIGAVVTVAAVAEPALTRLGWWPAFISRGFMRALERRLERDPREAFARRRIALVEAPVMLVHGARDRFVPVEHVHVLHAARPDAEVLLLRDAGHTSVAAFAPAIDPVVAFLRAHLDA